MHAMWFDTGLFSINGQGDRRERGGWFALFERWADLTAAPLKNNACIGSTLFEDTVILCVACISQCFFTVVPLLGAGGSTIARVLSEGVSV
jgi:hypothetical protein